MAEGKTLLVNCPNCHQKVMALEQADDTPFPFLREGDELPSWRYILATCEICWHIIALRETFVENASGKRQVIEVLWPVPERVLSETIPESLRREHAEARACFNARAHIATVVMVRRTLEGVCSAHNVSNKPLYAALDKMKTLGLIEGRLLEWAQELRVLGNDAAHFTGKTVSRQDAEDALTLAEALMDYLYVFSAQFEKFRARRKEQPPEDKPTSGSAPPPPSS